MSITVIVVVAAIIDFEIVPRFLPLPDDFCYYHTHKAPWWVDLFYINGDGHVHPPFSGLHICLFLLTSLGLAFYLTRKADKWLGRRLKTRAPD